MISEILTNEDKWVILKSLFDEKGLVRQHLDSYNNFIEEKMQEIVNESSEVVPDLQFIVHDCTGHSWLQD